MIGDGDGEMGTRMTGAGAGTGTGTASGMAAGITAGTGTTAGAAAAAAAAWRKESLDEQSKRSTPLVAQDRKARSTKCARGCGRP